jgi:hypothetical protein
MPTNEDTDVEWPYGPRDETDPRLRAHRSTVKPKGRSGLKTWAVLGAILAALVILTVIGLSMLGPDKGSQPQSVDPNFKTSSAPVTPKVAPVPAPEPTRTSIPELGPDNRTVVDGSTLVAGEHFAPGKWVAANAERRGTCVWAVTTARGTRKEGGMGPGPQATQRPIARGESLQTLGCGDWIWKSDR